SSTYLDSIHGTELPKATQTEGQFVGEASGGGCGAWYTALTHQVLPNNTSPVASTGGHFRLNTVMNYVPEEILGSFKSGYVQQIDGFCGCSNHDYRVYRPPSAAGVGW